MTEEEAKKRWCPFARVGAENTGLGSINRDCRLGEKTMAANCIGSACMAWRRTLLSQKERSAFVGSQLQLGMSSDDAYSMLNHMEEDNPSGYCGLAGTPPA